VVKDFPSRIFALISTDFCVKLLDSWLMCIYSANNFRTSIKVNVGRLKQDQVPMKAKTISVFIAVPPAEVYTFASNPANLPAWVPSFCKSVEFANGQWVIQSPEGPAVFAFVESNAYGVLDHTITFAPGLKLTNPMRVVPNGSGSELLFTLFQHEGMSDQQFTEDESNVQSDLDTLRRLLESKHG